MLSTIARAARSNAPTMTSLAFASRSTATFAFSAGAASAAARRSGSCPTARFLTTPMLRTSSSSSLPFSSSTSTQRGFFASAASASPSPGSSSLLSVLDTEIKYEAENAPQGAPELPQGWAFASGSGAEADGSARLTLVSKNPPAGEKVTVELLVDDQDDDEDLEDIFAKEGEGAEDAEIDDEDEEGSAFGDDDGGVVFTVAVAKDASPRSQLLFDCRSDGTYLQIMHVSLEKTKKEGQTEDDDDDAEFAGPHFDELDEALQAEFESYLEARGVSPSLGGALAALAEDKEAREYAAWLGKVRDFVAAR